MVLREFNESKDFWDEVARKEYWEKAWADIARMEAELKAHHDFLAFIQEYNRQKKLASKEAEQPENVLMTTEQSRK